MAFRRGGEKYYLKIFVYQKKFKNFPRGTPTVYVEIVGFRFAPMLYRQFFMITAKRAIKASDWQF